MASQAKREKMSEKRRIVRKNRAGPNMRCTEARSLRWASVCKQVGIGKRAGRGSLAIPDESTVNAGLNLRASPARCFSNRFAKGQSPEHLLRKLRNFSAPPAELVLKAERFTPRENRHMKIHSKAAIALLALVISTPLALAQDPGQGQQGPPDGPGGGRPTWQWQGRMGQDGQDGQWGRGERGWGHGGGMEMRGHGRPGFMLARLVNNPDIREKLGITDDQAAKIRQQSSAFRISEVRSRADVQVKRIELRDLLTGDNPDRAAIDSKLEEISAVRLAAAKARVDFALSMKDALTPEQRQKLKDMFSNRFREHGPGGFGGGPRHPHPMGPGQPGNAPTPNDQAPANPPSGPGAE